MMYHMKGTALILSMEARKSLNEWKPISEQIIFARIWGQDNMVLLSQKVAHMHQKIQALQEKAARGSR